MNKHHLSINTIGLAFEAEVNVWPPHPGSFWEPPEEASMEIITLTHETQDASFLLCSTAGEDIEMACWNALAELREEEP